MSSVSVMIVKKKEKYIMDIVNICPHCGDDVNEERWSMGYQYCMDSTCVALAIRGRMDGYRLILMPKQGFTYVQADSDDLLHGKSSGRS